MPIIKSAIKRAKQTLVRNSHNIAVKRAVHEDIRVLTDAIAAGDAKAIHAAMSAAQSEIDRAVKKGTLHKNTAARRKSRLAAKAAVVLSGTTSDAVAKPKAATKGTAAKKPVAKKAAAKKAPAKKPATKTTK
jgi:small subunit ribosomal protein S20